MRRVCVWGQRGHRIKSGSTVPTPCWDRIGVMTEEATDLSNQFCPTTLAVASPPPLRDFSTHFHTRTHPLTPPPTPSLPTTSPTPVRTNPPRSNDHAVHPKKLLTNSNYRATIPHESKPSPLPDDPVVSPPPLRPTFGSPACLPF
jgi:hypothetical protein